MQFGKNGHKEEEPRRTWRKERPYAAQKARLRDQVPYLAVEREPEAPAEAGGPGDVLRVATYNVHRWTGLPGGNRWHPALATRVIEELDADVIALQEALRPFDRDDPLERIADERGYYLTFVSTRVHRRGELGNAVLSRWPMSAVFTIDLSFSRLEQRSAVATQFKGTAGTVSVVATHLALVDRTRHRQVHSLLEHPHLQGPVVLLGDMNAWRRCRATRTLDDAFTALQGTRDWPASFPATKPVLALDRIYARGARVVSLHAHDTAAARRGSDHLPVLATIRL